MACYLYNGVEYMETMVATFKAAMVPVNTNYRYGPEEIFYLFDNADAEAVVFHASFTELLEGIRDRLPDRQAVVRRRRRLRVRPGRGRRRTRTSSRRARTLELTEWSRDGDDLLLLYTGGTTGMPKGVMWRQDDLFNVLGAGGNPLLGTGPAADVDEVAERAAEQRGRRR